MPPSSRRQAAVEIALIFAVFCLHGAWPAPDVNEPYYIGKAIHCWNPDWLRGDFFMESADTHKVFNYGLGWLSLWLSPVATIWTLRIFIWLVLAWAWRRLSVAVVPRRWCAVLTAALMVGLMERFHMAGEWIVGGAEAKGIAYALVFLGLESLVRNRWNRCLLWLGAAAAFHVLAGGWAAVAVGIAWLAPGRDRPPIRHLWPGIFGGLLLALPGLIPSLLLDRGVDAQTASLAHEIHVFERLPHHLTLVGMPPHLVLRMALLWMFWILFGQWGRRAAATGEYRESLMPLRRLRAFVAGAVFIALVGAALQPVAFVDRTLAANLLRFYWFRLVDVALPLGLALESVMWIDWTWSKRPALSRACLALALLAAAFDTGDHAMELAARPFPRAHYAINPMASQGQQEMDFEDWRAACLWAANSGKIPPDARFLTPRLTHTFLWYSGHSEVASWKNVPQDAKKIVEWRNRIHDMHATGKEFPEPFWRRSLAELSPARLCELGAKYGADYAIVGAWGPPLDLPEVYRNRSYVIYRLESAPSSRHE